MKKLYYFFSIFLVMSVKAMEQYVPVPSHDQSLNVITSPRPAENSRLGQRCYSRIGSLINTYRQELRERPCRTLSCTAATVAIPLCAYIITRCAHVDHNCNWNDVF